MQIVYFMLYIFYKVQSRTPYFTRYPQGPVDSNVNIVKKSIIFFDMMAALYIHSAFKHGPDWRVMEPMKSKGVPAMLKE